MGSKFKTKEDCIQEIDRLNELLTGIGYPKSKAPRKRETRFTDQVDHPLMWNWELNKKGQYTFASLAVNVILGYSPEEVLGKNFYEFYHPAKKSLLKDRIKKVYKSGNPLREIITENLHKNGSTVWLSSSAVPIFNDKGNLAGYRGVDVNITELKNTMRSLEESEEKHRKLMERANDAILVADTQTGNIIDANNNTAQLINRPIETIIGHHFTEIHPSEETAKYNKIFNRFISKGRDLSGELYIQDCNGTKIPVEISSSISEWKGNNIIQLIYRDLRERKKMEEERIKSSKLESLGLLAGGIAHDLNNLLTAIWGNITLTKMYMDNNNNVLTIINELEDILNQAKKLTLQFLTFSKGGTPVTKTYKTDEIIEDSIRFALRGTNLSCSFHFKDNLDCINIDEGQFKQAINNIIINASQAMPKGGNLIVSAKKIFIDDPPMIPVKTGEYLKLRITDHGTGIMPQHLDKIFDPYFSTNNNRHGLGLSTSYSIIRKHNGYITAESKLSQETTITVYLPIVEDIVDHHPSSKPMATKIQFSPKTSPKSSHIMIMDDEESIRNVTGHMLSILGYHVIYAANGTEAINLYKQNKETGTRVDCIIMDLTIPGGMGGEETITKLRTLDPDVKAIVSSGYYDSPVMSNYKDYGFINILPKPYTIENLAETLQKSILKD